MVSCYRCAYRWIWVKTSYVKVQCFNFQGQFLLKWVIKHGKAMVIGGRGHLTKYWTIDSLAQLDWSLCMSKIVMLAAYRFQSRTNKKECWVSGNYISSANTLHNVTSRLSNTTRKYIFTEYHSSITQYLYDLDFCLSRSLKVKSIGAIRLPIYGFLLMFNCNIRYN